MERIRFDKYPLGFWSCYPYGIEGMTEQEIADMADCGMTLTMSPSVSHEKREAAFRALDLCEKYGIKLILSDSRTLWTGVRAGEDTYRKALREAYEDYGGHPAVFGFFLGDEPAEWQLEQCTVAYRAALEEFHGLVPYMNMNPGYADICRGFVKDSGCRLLSYDRYNQMNPGHEGAADFIGDFSKYKKLAEDMNIPLLSIMLSVGHYRYSVPGVDDFRWQMGVALASGANAIFWFTYHTPIRSNNYRGGPISEFGEKNPTWYALKDLQRKFNRDYADLFNHSDWKGVYWFKKEYPIDPYIPGCPEHAETYGLLNVESVLADAPALVTFLDGRDEYAGKHYIMITNNTWDTPDLFVLRLPADCKKVWRVYADNEVDFEASHWDAQFYRNDDCTKACVYLAPGQFEIFRVE